MARHLRGHREPADRHGPGTATPGTAGGTVSGANAVTGIVLTSGTDASGYRFDDTTGRLSGTVFSDTDRNGTLNTGEPGREAGLVVTATGPGGTRTTTTAADGTYAFAGLLAGGYTVTFTAPTGSSLTSPGSLSATLPRAAASRTSTSACASSARRSRSTTPPRRRSRPP